MNLNSNKFLNEVSKSDLGVGEGGNAAIERYIIGLPSLNFVTNDNQKKILNLKTLLGSIKKSSMIFFQSLEKKIYL